MFNKKWVWLLTVLFILSGCGSETVSENKPDETTVCETIAEETTAAETTTEDTTAAETEISEEIKEKIIIADGEKNLSVQNSIINFLANDYEKLDSETTDHMTFLKNAACRLDEISKQSNIEKLDLHTDYTIKYNSLAAVYAVVSGDSESLSSNIGTNFNIQYTFDGTSEYRTSAISLKGRYEGLQTDADLSDISFTVILQECDEGVKYYIPEMKAYYISDELDFENEAYKQIFGSLNNFFTNIYTGLNIVYETEDIGELTALKDDDVTIVSHHIEESGEYILEDINFEIDDNCNIISEDGMIYLSADGFDEYSMEFHANLTDFNTTKDSELLASADECEKYSKEEFVELFKIGYSENYIDTINQLMGW